MAFVTNPQQEERYVSERRELLGRIVADISTTNYRYLSLFRTNVKPQTFPYFGNPVEAKFATFGVNPSAAEFHPTRWPNSTPTLTELDLRAVSYFRNLTVPAHPWFDGYKEALRILGHSYDGDTVHLDLSPRATKAMGTADRGLFIQMIAADIKWFIGVLELCKGVKAAIMSGSVTGKYYFDEFLKAHLPESYFLKLRTRLENRQRGAASLYDLIGPGLSIPVFFCRTSPRGDRGVRLTTETQGHLAALKAAGF